MDGWGQQDVQNIYAGLNSRKRDRAGWLQPVGTALGAGAGFLVGGPAGAVAGSQLGGAAGGLGHDAANGNLTPQGVMGSAMEGVSGYQGLDKSMQAKALIEAFMQNPHQFRLGFATGGPVLSPSMDPNLLQRLLYGSQGAGVPSGPTQTAQGDPGASSDVLGAIPGQVQQMIGQPPVQPTVGNGQLGALQTAQHPTLEALSALLPQIMAAMPRPANPKNNKAIGAWLPAAGLALSAPAAIAQSRRASANAPIQAGNESRQADYEARKKAYEAQQGTLMNTLAGNATKPEPVKETPYDQRPMTAQEAAQVAGDARWVGVSRYDYKLWADKQAQREAQRHARTMESLAVRAAADKAREAGDTDWMSNLVRQTSTGQPYLDMSGLSPKDYKPAQLYAFNIGAKPLNKAQVDKVSRIEDVRQNISDMTAQAELILTPSNGIVARGTKAATNTVGALTQRNPVAAAWGTWRITAIQQIVALAGGMGSGVRVNQAEIKQAVENDIPRITDNLTTARQKAANILRLLDNAEAALLGGSAQPIRVVRDEHGVVHLADAAQIDPAAFVRKGTP